MDLDFSLKTVISDAVTLESRVTNSTVSTNVSLCSKDVCEKIRNRVMHTKTAIDNPVMKETPDFLLSVAFILLVASNLVSF